MTPNLLVDYMTRPELAVHLGVCERTLIRWCDRGEGPPMTKLGQRPLFRRQSVEAWLAAREARKPRARA